MEKNGIASTSRSTTLAIAHGQGCALTFRPHRANAEFSCRSRTRSADCLACSPDVSPARCARTRADSDLTFWPATAIRAGPKVSAASMLIATVMAAARPSAPTKATSEMYRPRMEMTTVLPATTTAAPDVLSACRMEATTSDPVSSCSRCRASRNRP